MFTSLLDRHRGVFNRLRHFLKVSDVFLTVYVTFTQKGRCFVLFTSLLDIQRGVFNGLRQFYKVRHVFFNYFRQFYIAMEVFCIVYVTLR